MVADGHADAMKRLAVLLLLLLVSCRQARTPGECHHAVRYLMEPSYACVWQDL